MANVQKLEKKLVLVDQIIALRFFTEEDDSIELRIQSLACSSAVAGDEKELFVGWYVNNGLQGVHD